MTKTFFFSKLWPIFKYIDAEEKQSVAHARIKSGVPLAPLPPVEVLFNPYWYDIRNLALSIRDGELFAPKASEYLSEKAFEAEANMASMLARHPGNIPETIEMAEKFSFVWELRETMVKTYCYPILPPHNVQLIAHFAGRMVVEMGAGSGYLAYMLSQFHIDVLAFDKYIRPGWASVREGTPQDLLNQDPNRTLILSWPHPEDKIDIESIRHFQGTRVIFIGSFNEMTATKEFEEEMLHSGRWEEIAFISTPSYPTCHDNIFIFDRVK